VVEQSTGTGTGTSIFCDSLAANALRLQKIILSLNQDIETCRNLCLKHHAADATALSTSTVDAQTRTLIDKTKTISSNKHEKPPALLLLGPEATSRPYY
jgi:hypothetical protein